MERRSNNKWQFVVVVVAAAATTAGLVRYSGAALACSSGGCETVQRSAYSEIFGIPVAAFGLVGYATLFVGAALRGELARYGQALVALTALGFSTYLLFVQLHVIDALC